MFRRFFLLVMFLLVLFNVSGALEWDFTGTSVVLDQLGGTPLTTAGYQSGSLVHNGSEWVYVNYATSPSYTSGFFIFNESFDPQNSPDLYSIGYVEDVNFYPQINETHPWVYPDSYFDEMRVSNKTNYGVLFDFDTSSCDNPTTVIGIWQIITLLVFIGLVLILAVLVLVTI